MDIWIIMKRLQIQERKKQQTKSRITGMSGSFTNLNSKLISTANFAPKLSKIVLIAAQRHANEMIMNL